MTDGEDFSRGGAGGNTTDRNTALDGPRPRVRGWLVYCIVYIGAARTGGEGGGDLAPGALTK